MTNTYYTPQLNDLKIGLEYEECVGYNKWENHTIENLYDLEWVYDQCTHIKVDCLSNIIRVKQLDIEDIVSLGFVQKDILFELDDLTIQYAQRDRNIIIYHKELNLVFNGSIKNKIELIEVLDKIK